MSCLDDIVKRGDDRMKCGDDLAEGRDSIVNAQL